MEPVDICNKFFLFIERLSLKQQKWVDYFGYEHLDDLPDFILQIEWDCDLEHMIHKWKFNFGNLQEKFAKFYITLDEYNKKQLVNYIMKL